MHERKMHHILWLNLKQLFERARPLIRDNYPGLVLRVEVVKNIGEYLFVEVLTGY